MAINDKIYIGSIDSPIFIFDETQIERINFDNSVDIINDELSADTLEVSLFYDDEDGRLRATNYATPLFYYSENRLVSKYYVSRVERIDLKKYKIYSTSLIGLIEKENFYGGFYTGERFQDVLNDILFTNGVNMDKYNVYASVTNKPNNVIYGSYLLGKTSSVDEWKYRLRVEYTASEPNWGTSSTWQYYDVAGFRNTGGSTIYSIRMLANRADTSSPSYWQLVLQYGTQTKMWPSVNDYKFGAGSRFIVDIVPMEGKGYLHVDYVDADDPTITGTVDEVWNITLYTPQRDIRSYHACLSVAFGMSQFRSGYDSPEDIFWTYGISCVIFHKQQVYDENGIMLLDALYAVNTSTQTGYMVNAVTGEMIENSTIQTVGDAAYTVSDFSRMERDKELSNSLIFGESVADLPIRGWIKMESRRNALHELLFAENVNMLKTGNGEYLFTTLSKDSSGEIDEDTIYDNSSEEEMTGAKKISVTEHSYETSDVASEKIFDNTSSFATEGEYLAKFDKAPIFGTPVGNGITIKKFNCNVAIVEGRGTITGTPYRHSESVIQYVSNLADGTDVSVRDIGIITSANSDNVMNKLKAYYSGDLKKIKNDIVYKGQRCGLIYDFKNLFHNSNSGYLKKISSVVSSFIRAVCEFISGYVPPSSGGYVNFSVFEYNESWTVPNSVRTREYSNVRLNIIGKGHEGTNGTNGSNGSLSQSGSGSLPGGDGGNGGNAGVGGSGGNIYIVTVDIENVARIEVSNTNYDTIVKTYNDNNVLVNTYSSASGNAIDTGFTNVFNGIVYARKGQDGVAGGKGGKGGSYSSYEAKYIDPESGESVGVYTGGTAPLGIMLTEQTIGGTSYMYNSFGGGGGAAYGANGGNAREQWRLDSTIHTEGGAGANALQTADVYTEYGSGGFGGNGGGGGGGGASRYSDFAAATGRNYESFPEDPGIGGTGSSGTPGIDGCLIVYY